MDLTDQEQESRRQALRRWVGDRGGHAEVVRLRKLTPSQASYLSQVMNGYSFASRAARNMEQRLGLPAGFLERRNVAGDIAGLATASGSTIPSAELQAHDLSQWNPRMEPQRLTWEAIMRGTDLGEQFVCTIPDDQAAPDFPAGTDIVWSTAKEPRIGSLLLVRDQRGGVHIRERRQAKTELGWFAAAIHPAYQDFEPDEITIIAAGLRVMRDLT